MKTTRFRIFTKGIARSRINRNKRDRLMPRNSKASGTDRISLSMRPNVAYFSQAAQQKNA